MRQPRALRCRVSLIVVLLSTVCGTAGGAEPAGVALELPTSFSTEGVLPVRLGFARLANRTGDASGWRLDADLGQGRYRLAGGAGSFLEGDLVRMSGVQGTLRLSSLQAAPDGGLLGTLSRRYGPDPTVELSGDQAQAAIIDGASGFTAIRSPTGPDRVEDAGRWLMPQGCWLDVTPDPGSAFGPGSAVQLALSPRRFTVTQRFATRAGRCVVAVIGEAPVTGLQPGTELQVVHDRIRMVQWSWEPIPGWAAPLGQGVDLLATFAGTDSDPWRTVLGNVLVRSDPYRLQATVQELDGRVHEVASQIRIHSGAPPTAGASQHGTAGAGGPPARLDGSASADDYGIVEWRWDVDLATDSDGDGIPGNDLDQSGRRVLWTYAAAGTYQARLTVVDGAGQTATTLVPVVVAAAAPPLVQPVLISGDPSLPIPAIDNVPARIQVLVTAAGATTIAWDFGDGTSSAATSLPVHGRASVDHVFRGPVGSRFVVTCTVRDAGGRQTVAQTAVQIQVDSTSTRQGLAIYRGLWGLLGLRSGYGWYQDSHIAGPTASAVQAFAVHGHLPDGDPFVDPYVEVVRRGRDFMVKDLRPLAGYGSVGTEGGTLDDANGALNSVESYYSYYVPYQFGLVMDALVAIGQPLHRLAPAPVRGRRVVDVARDMVDAYTWGQSPGGGWRYVWNDNLSDNSASQWAAIGMLATDQMQGQRPPAWVLVRNQSWLQQSSFTTGEFGYGIGNRNLPYHGSSAGGMVQLVWQGIDGNHAWWQRAEDALTTIWWPQSVDHFYTLYAAAKALRLHAPAPVERVAGTFDWWGDAGLGLQHLLLAHPQHGQKPDGTWPAAPLLDPPLTTSWSLILLAPHLFRAEPSRVGGKVPVAVGTDRTVPTDAGKAYATVTASAVNTGSYDPDGQPITVALVPPGPFPVGVNQVRLRATDPHGMQGEAPVVITVEDREAPRLAQGQLVVGCDPGVAHASRARLPRPLARDNVGVASLVVTAPDPLPLGTQVVRWTARDAAGNQAQLDVAVQVVDQEPPQITAPPPVVAWLLPGQSEATGLELGVPVVTDNVGVTALTNAAPAAFPLGLTTVTWTANDAAGNSSTAGQQVDVRVRQEAEAVLLTSPGPGGTFTASSTLTATVAVVGVPSGRIRRVDLEDNGVIVHSRSVPPWELPLARPAPGGHALRALVEIDGPGGVVTLTSSAAAITVVEGE